MGDSLKEIDPYVGLARTGEGGFTLSYPAGKYVINPAKTCSTDGDGSTSAHFVINNPSYPEQCIYMNVCDANQALCFSDIYFRKGVDVLHATAKW